MKYLVKTPFVRAESNSFKGYTTGDILEDQPEEVTGLLAGGLIEALPEPEPVPQEAQKASRSRKK